MSDMHPGEEFLYWIGNCITAWAKVQEYLFQICARLLQTSPELAAIVYYRTPTLETRLQLIDELVRAVLPKKVRRSGGHDHEDVKEWDDLRKYIGQQLHTRNRIAHHPVAKQELNVPTLLDGRGILSGATILEGMSWFEIYVSEGERLRGKSEDIKPLMGDDLTRHLLAVHEISARLHKFLHSTPSQHV